MNNRTYKMILVSLFAALMAVGAFLKIPLPPVAFTMQIFFAIFSGLILGSKLALASQVIYIALGLAGVPVFTGGGGLSYVFSPSFGYLVGFAAAAFVVGLISERSSKQTICKFFIASFAGLIVCYAVGVPYLYIITKYVNHANTTASGVLTSGFLLFLPWDIVKIALASWLAKQIHGRVKPAGAYDA